MTQNLIIAVSVVLFLVVLFLLYRVQSITGVLSQSDKDNDNSTNSLMGYLLIGFFLSGITAFAYYTYKYWDEMMIPVASEHGPQIDSIFAVTTYFMVAAFAITNFLLFFFAFKYRYRRNVKATFFPHNNKLELIWTVIPAIVLSILVFSGAKTWTSVMDKAPEDVIKLEIRGEQFAWQVRYPGKDNTFGEIDFRKIDAVNQFGMLCEDPASADDFFASEIHIPVNKPVLFKIRARDVLHSVFAPHFRLKMDAVPGMPTKFWFTPTKTTKEMQAETGNPDFKYEIACAEVCGRGHFGMKKIIVVETEEEYNKWLSEQKPFFERNPEVCNPGIASEVKPVVADSTTVVADSSAVVADSATVAKDTTTVK